MDGLDRTEARQLLRFTVVGGANTLVALVVYSLALWLDLGYVLGAVAGYAAGIANGYVWNRSWTFRSSGRRRREFTRYVVVSGGGLAANTALLVLAVEELGIWKLAAEAISLVPIIAVTFVINRRWTFHAE